ncbi:MAG: rubredoxin-like domain-containing protein [Desulfobaccales bacterium]|jgi:rubrerythrin
MNDPEAQPYWKCSNCGSTLQAPLPPDICPMCRG